MAKSKKMSLKTMEESFERRLQDVESAAERTLEEVQDLLELYDSLREERKRRKR